MKRETVGPVPETAKRDSPTSGRRTRLTGADRRKQIIARASALFAKRGFNGATVNDIARSCRISEAMLYRHFKSKQDLHVAVLEEKIRKIDVDAFLSTLDRDRPIGELLEAVALYILATAKRDAEINKLLLFGTLQGSTESKALFKAWRQPFVDFLHGELLRRIEAGKLRDADPLITARSFVGMVMDCSVSCSLWPEFGYAGFEPHKSVANNVAVIVRGLEKVP